MEFHGSHPLDNITRNNPYSMLEALIPFVDYPMKLPLALLVKYYEVRLIMNAFQSVDTLSRYGLHNTANDPLDMLSNIMGISPDMLKSIMSLMDTQYSDLTKSSNPDQYKQSTQFGSNEQYQSNTGTDSFDDNIKNIFAEYDMLQAAEYSSEDYNEPDLNSNESLEPEYYI